MQGPGHVHRGARRHGGGATADHSAPLGHRAACSRRAVRPEVAARVVRSPGSRVRGCRARQARRDAGRCLPGKQNGCAGRSGQQTASKRPTTRRARRLRVRHFGLTKMAAAAEGAAAGAPMEFVRGEGRSSRAGGRGRPALTRLGASGREGKLRCVWPASWPLPVGSCRALAPATRRGDGSVRLPQPHAEEAHHDHRRGHGHHDPGEPCRHLSRPFEYRANRPKPRTVPSRGRLQCRPPWHAQAPLPMVTPWPSCGRRAPLRGRSVPRWRTWHGPDGSGVVQPGCLAVMRPRPPRCAPPRGTPWACNASGPVTGPSLALLALAIPSRIVPWPRVRHPLVQPQPKLIRRSASLTRPPSVASASQTTTATSRATTTSFP